MVGMGWQFRTLAMYTVMSAILMAIGAFVGFLFNGIWIGILICLAISIGVCIYTYFYSKESALRANHARIVSESEYPELYAIVREVAQAGNLPMPEVGVCETEMPNAFATGRNPDNAAVVVTTGIMKTLPRNELKGVIAHEMSHVKNRDILVMSIAAGISSVISCLANIAYYYGLFHSFDSDSDADERLWVLLVTTLLQIFVPLAAFLVQLGISRNREFLADETGARMINDPLSLARALEHISSVNVEEQKYETQTHETRGRAPEDNYNYAHMWISNPLKEDSLVNKLFSTHPPMNERIARLQKLAQEMGKF